MHRLPSHTVTSCDLHHRRAIKDLEHRPIPLLHNPQLHQHDRLLPDDHHIARKANTSGANGKSNGVSPTYRNDCLLPTGTTPATCRLPKNPNVKHEPEKHTLYQVSISGTRSTFADRYLHDMIV
jgi:hypothetical protein